MRKVTLFGLVLATLVVACESKTPVGPSAVTIEQVTTTATSCTYSLSPPNGAVPLAGGSGTITVVTQTGCAWTVENFANWVTVQPATGGTGAGQIQYTASATTTARETTIVVAGLAFLLRQDAAAAGTPPGATTTVLPTSVTRRYIGSSGNPALPNDMTLALQLITASSVLDLLLESIPFHDPQPLGYSVTGVYRTGNGGGGTVRGTLEGSLDDGIFNGSLSTEVPGCSAGREYTGQLSVSTLQWTGGRVIRDCKDNPLSFSNLTMVSGGAALPPTTTIPTTTAPGCTYGLNPGSGSIGLEGGSGSVEVVTQPGCGWSAQSVVNWITVQPTSGAAGPGRVQYTVTAASAPRESTLIIAGLPFVLRQGAAATTSTTTTAQACTYSLSPTTATVAAAGGAGAITVVTQGGCAWSVQNFANWIAVQPPSGTGTGQVQWTATATTAAREATIVVAGIPFLLRQDAPPITAQADLVPISRADSTYCRYADSYDLTGLVIGVGNQGSGAAGTSRARITYTYSGTSHIFERDTAALGVGTSTDVVFPLPGSCTNYSCSFTFSVQVDAGGQISESVETNNVAFGSCTGGYGQTFRRPGAW